MKGAYSGEGKSEHFFWCPSGGWPRGGSVWRQEDTVGGTLIDPVSDDEGSKGKSVREKMDVRNIGKVRSLGLCVKVVLWSRVLPDMSLQVRKAVLVRTK